MPEFRVEYPVAGTFSVHVDTVCENARLDISLDGKPALRRELPVENIEGKRSAHQAEYNVWQCVYDEWATIDVPAGDRQAAESLLEEVGLGPLLRIRTRRRVERACSKGWNKRGASSASMPTPVSVTDITSRSW